MQGEDRDRIIRSKLSHLVLPDKPLINYDTLERRSSPKKWVYVEDANLDWWLCTRYFYVESITESAIGDLEYAGFTREQAKRILYGKPSKEEVEAWMAAIALSLL